MDGYDAIAACYRYSGALGIHPRGLTLRELWTMYCGKMHAIRQQVVWQSIVLFHDKLDVERFLRVGSVGPARGNRVTMSDELRAKVEAEIGRMNGVIRDGG